MYITIFSLYNVHSAWFDTNIYIYALVGGIKNSKLRMLENRMLRKIFGQKRDEVTGDWRRLHSESLNEF